MIDYREILRLKSQGYSQRQIQSSVGSSRNTIREVIALAEEKNLNGHFLLRLLMMILRSIFIPAEHLQ